MTQQSKKCSKCGETKPTTDFCIVKRNKDGLNMYCRACMFKRYAKLRGIPDNTDAIMNNAINTLQFKYEVVYTDELIKTTGLTRERITRHLKQNGFVKPCGHLSKRWIKHDSKISTQTDN